MNSHSPTFCQGVTCRAERARRERHAAPSPVAAQQSTEPYLLPTLLQNPTNPATSPSAHLAPPRRRRPNPSRRSPSTPTPSSSSSLVRLLGALLLYKFQPRERTSEAPRTSGHRLLPCRSSPLVSPHLSHLLFCPRLRAFHPLVLNPSLLPPYRAGTSPSWSPPKRARRPRSPLPLSSSLSGPSRPIRALLELAGEPQNLPPPPPPLSPSGNGRLVVLSGRLALWDAGEARACDNFG